MKTQQAHEVWQITEMRDNAVYKTKSLGIAWITQDLVLPDEFILSSLSFKDLIKFNYMVFRSITDDKPDIEFL